jgi:hypothetical protein
MLGRCMTCWYWGGPQGRSEAADNRLFRSCRAIGTLDVHSETEQPHAGCEELALVREDGRPEELQVWPFKTRASFGCVLWTSFSVGESEARWDPESVRDQPDIRPKGD